MVRELPRMHSVSPAAESSGTSFYSVTCPFSYLIIKRHDKPIPSRSPRDAMHCERKLFSFIRDRESIWESVGNHFFQIDLVSVDKDI